MHIIRLGHLDTIDGQPTLTLQDPNNQERKSFGLKQETYDMLASLDPTVHDRVFTDEETARLNEFEQLGVVSMVSEEILFEGYPAFSIVPVFRKPVRIVETLEEGYLFRSEEEGAKDFYLSEYGARFALHSNPASNLLDILHQVEAEALADVDSKEAFLDEEELADFVTDDYLMPDAEPGEDFNDYLAREAFTFIKNVLDADVATFESPFYGPRTTEA